MKIDAKYVPEPKFGKTALELLDARFAEPPSVSSKYGIQFSCGLLGGLVQVLKNWSYRRPLIAGKLNNSTTKLLFQTTYWHFVQFFNVFDCSLLGAYLYPVYFAAGWVTGQLLTNYRQNYYAERDAVYRHYIELHPEDFPPPGTTFSSKIMHSNCIQTAFRSIHFECNFIFTSKDHFKMSESDKYFQTYQFFAFKFHSHVYYLYFRTQKVRRSFAWMGSNSLDTIQSLHAHFFIDIGAFF